MSALVYGSNVSSQPKFTASDYQAQKKAREDIQTETRAKREQEKQQAIQTAYEKASSLSKRNLYYGSKDQKAVEAARGYKSFAEQRYTSETLGKPKESQPVFTAETIEAQKNPQSRIDQPKPILSKGVVVGVQDVRLKQSYGISSVSKDDFRTFQAERNIKARRDEDVSRDRTGSGYFTMGGSDSMVSQKRIQPIQNEVRSEKTAIDWTSPYTALKTSYPLLGKTSSKLEYEAFKTTSPLERQAKRFGAFGLGAVESFSYPILFPIKAVKQTVSSFFDPIGTIKSFGEGIVLEPGKTTGQVGGSLLFGEVIGQILKPSVSKPNVKILVEESGTKRITTDLLTTDITQSNVKAMINKKNVIDLKGVAIQDIFKLDDTLFGVKGKAEVFKLNKLTPSGSQLAFSDIIGAGLKQEGGFDTLLYSRSKVSGKPYSYSRTAIQTADLASEPYQVFKEVSITQDITKKTPKLKSVSFGITSEIGVLDIAEPRNFLRKNILTESKEPIAVEQYLGTDRGTLSAKTFGEQFEYKRYNKFAQTVQDQNLLGKVEKVDVQNLRSGNQLLFGKTELKTTPTSSQVLSSLQKDTLMSMAEQNLASQRTSQSALKITGTTGNLFSLKSTSYQPTTTTKREIKEYTISQPKQKEYSITRNYYNVGVSSKGILKSNLFEKSFSKIEPKSIIKPMSMFESKQIVQSKQIVESKQVYEPQSIFKQKQTQITSPIITPGEIIVPFPLSYKSYPEARKKKKKAYVALLKRKGKFKRISQPLSLGSALDIGTKAAVGTLGATFKVKEVGGEPLNIQTGGQFSKYKGMFRDFKLKKGQKQYLEPMTFIQKRGTRLGSFGEVSEIQQARKVKMFG